MVAEAAHVWAVEPQFSADRRDPRGAQLVAAKRESRGRSQQRHPTDTEDLDREERATEPRAERPQRCQWQEDNSSHFGGGARSLGLGRMGRARGEGPREDIAKSWEGNWRKELLFVLRQEVELYRTYPEKIYDCDLELREHRESIGSKVDLPAQPRGPKPKGKKSGRNTPPFDWRTEL